MQSQEKNRSEPNEDLQELADDLTALANVQRLRLVHMLTRPKYGEEIADALDMTRQSALKHVEKLEDRGFVRALHGRRETGPVVEYQVVPKRLFAVGVRLSDLGKLEPEGGPKVKINDKTMVAGEHAPPRPVEHEGHLPGGGPHHLLVMSGPHAGTRVPFDGEATRWTLGRDEDRNVLFEHDPYVSSRHAEIHRTPRGFEVVDVHSANGTYVNFKRIPRGGRIPLKVGDVIGVGHSYVVFQQKET